MIVSFHTLGCGAVSSERVSNAVQTGDQVTSVTEDLNHDITVYFIANTVAEH